MSLSASLRPASRSTQVPTRARHLRPVGETRSARRPRVVYALAAVGAVLAIVLAQVGLTMATTADSYRLRTLNSASQELMLQKQALFEVVTGLSSPQYLAANASALGMVIGAAPTYLRLSDGKVVGAGEAAWESSAVDAVGRRAVANALVTGTPLVTDPEATIQGAPLAEIDLLLGGALPAPITDGLPTPETR